MTAAAQEVAGLPDMKVSVRQVFGIDSDMEVPAYSEARRARPGCRSGLPLRPPHHARDPGRLRAQPPRHRHRLSRHRQVDPCRAGRGAAQLAVRARQSRQPHQPYRPDRQGRDRHPRRPAGHRVPRRHPAVGLPAQRRALLRRIRRRPPGRDVRDPARAGILGPPDAARPEPRDPAASGVPPVRHRQHDRPRRHLGPLSRHAADQPGADGPLVDRHHAQLSAARQRGRDRARQGEALSHRGRPRHRQQDGAGRRPHAQRLHERRYLDRDEPAHGDHLGGERRHLQGRRLRVPADLPQQMRRARAADRGRVLSALLRRGTAGELGERGAELGSLPPAAGRVGRAQPKTRRSGCSVLVAPAHVLRSG